MVTKQQVDKAYRLFLGDATVEHVIEETKLTRPAADRIVVLVRQGCTQEEILRELGGTGFASGKSGSKDRRRGQPPR